MEENKVIQNNDKLSDNEKTFINDIRDIVTTAKENTYRTTNIMLVISNWLIGRRIVQEEQNGAARAEYGKHIIEIASEALTKAFGKGYGATSLRNCRKFCLNFKALSIQQPLLAEFVQPAVGQIESSSSQQNDSETVQTVSAQIESVPNSESAIVQAPPAQIVQTLSGQLPKILDLTTSKTNQLWTLRN